MNAPLGPHVFVHALPVRSTLDDLVVSKRSLGRLGGIVGAAMDRRKATIDGKSRAGPDTGLVAIFHGPSVSDKALAAEAIAGTLQAPLYRIDSGRVIGKYIGETEKNLAAIFDEAERRGAVLLFEEAEALFGKRSEVKDAHDRYANIEIDYLLQKIDAHEGVVILVTSRKQAIDEAFLRRMRFTAAFPFPGAG